MHSVKWFSALALSALCCPALQAQTPAQPVGFTNVDPHSTADWALIAPHLPDPTRAAPEKLEVAGDVLRARQFPSDAMTYYRAAAMRGGNPSRLLKKEGVLHLEQHQGQLARLCFKEALHFNKHDAEAWNNLGASDYMLGNLQESVSEYKHSVKLNRDSAIFHSNLSLAYFEVKNTRRARKELAKAFAIDPEILHHNAQGGVTLQVLASSHYAEVCLEMARVSAANGDREGAIDWLTKASQRGMDLRAALKSDRLLQPFLEDAEVKLLLNNADTAHGKELARTRLPMPVSDTVPR